MFNLSLINLAPNAEYSSVFGGCFLVNWCWCWVVLCSLFRSVVELVKMFAVAITSVSPLDLTFKPQFK